MAGNNESVELVPARQGKLTRWLEDMINLRKAGISYRGICRYLGEKGVHANAYEVRGFLMRCGRDRLLAAAQPEGAEEGTAITRDAGEPREAADVRIHEEGRHSDPLYCGAQAETDFAAPAEASWQPGTPCPCCHRPMPGRRRTDGVRFKIPSGRTH